MKNKPFIFTEAYNCGIILRKCLESFFKYHPDETVNVFGTAKDFKELGKFKGVEYFELSEDLELKECFKHGHLGTAHIGARVINEFSAGHDFIVHFDSDVIFRRESMSLLYDGIEKGYSLIGPRRCYKNNMNNRKDLGELKDVTQTYFYAFDKTKITPRSFQELRQMIVGFYNPLNHPILDYFDPVSFDIISNGGEVLFLDVDDVGGLTESGTRDNALCELNKDMDFGAHLVHFAGVGSGMKFYHKGLESASSDYSSWAISRYALYSKTILSIELPGIFLDESNCKLINEELNETI